MIVLPVLLALAQAADPAAPDQIVSLRQITVTLTPGDAAGNGTKASRLKQAASYISSCDQVGDVAMTLHGKISAAEGVRLSTVPEPLRSQLATLPLGTASRVFGAQEKYVRVIVVCSRTPG